MPSQPTALDELLTRASSAYGFTVEPAALDQWLGALGTTSPATVDAGVVLACALFHRQPDALAAFERVVVPRARAALRKLGAPDAEADEHLQTMRTRLMADAQGARLRRYRGTGSFEAFAATIAVRALTDAHRREPALASADAVPRLAAELDLERQLARHGQRQHFSAAFRDALEGLAPRERALLKLNLVDGASIDELAPVYQASRATVARWLALARQSLRRATLQKLSARTRLAGADLDSLLTSLDSCFDLSLRRFVTEAADDQRS